MLRRFPMSPVKRKLFSSLVQQFARSLNGTGRGKEKWDLFSGVCLERRPIISVDLIEIESKFLKLLNDIEFENSLKSDHEVRKEKERKQAELMKKGMQDMDLDVSLKQMAQDLEDAYQVEFSSFKAADRVTEDDLRINSKSLNRALDKYLILVVNQNLGGNYVWSLPQGVRGDGETMRQAAERVLAETCGSNLKAKFLGNAPCGFYKYKYPQSLRSKELDASVGAKVFFFKAWFEDGQVQYSKGRVNSHKWLSNEELLKELPEQYYKSVSQFLVA